MKRAKLVIAWNMTRSKHDGSDPVRRLVDDYRTRCLWFLRRDHYPATDAARDRVLRLIARHGDLDAFRRVAGALPRIRS